MPATAAAAASSSSSPADDAPWLASARQWLEWDMNAGTKAQVQQLVDANDSQALRRLFHRRLAFGTAGLRAAMGPGTNAINDLVVVQTAQGICETLVDAFGVDETQRRGVAIGYDHRAAGSLNSRRFAELTAAVCVHRGIKVYLYEGFVATPLVPYCVEQKQCVAGVMVTASHNPKADNGYKLYWDNGCQIIPPVDASIAAAILRALAPWTDYNALLPSLATSPLVEDPTEELTAAYFAHMTRTLCRFPEDNAAATLRIAYTAMHGVGHAFTSRSFAAFGHVAYVPVAEQLLPDPEFPTVAFPNPEEGKGALQLAMATAETSGARLILANDPDADRLAVAERDAATGDWTVFTGNEIGVLLGHWAFTQEMERQPEADPSHWYFVASTVSSKMLRAVAQREGLQFAETLTGFKWMGNKTAELRAQGHTVLFSFEEAIGFCLGDLVKDKDGVVAAAVFAEMAVQLEKRHQRTVAQHLTYLYERYGHFVTQNSYLKCYDAAVIAKIFERLRNGGEYWSHCGDFEIQHVRDLTTGYDSAQSDHRALLPVDSATQMITYSFANGCVATLRTSGTEPKLKYYVELAGQVGQTRAEVKQELARQVEAIVENMLQPEVNGLERPAEQ